MDGERGKPVQSEILIDSEKRYWEPDEIQESVEEGRVDATGQNKMNIKERDEGKRARSDRGDSFLS